MENMNAESLIILPGSGKPSGKITFSSYNLPALDDGLYKITVDHSFQANEGSAQPHIPTQTRYFAALGPRYALDPKEIALQFPPPGTSGNYYDVLPHIMFTRAILPWERRLDTLKQETPWLTLVCITQDEILAWQTATGDTTLLTVRTDTLTNVCQKAQANNIVFPKLAEIALVPGESPDETVNYLDVPEALLQLVLAAEGELPMLANVRQSADASADGSTNPKFPVLICNRSPQPGQENAIFLLSLENRTDVYAQLNSLAPLAGVPVAAPAPRRYRFAVLSTWRFASVQPELGFGQLLDRAERSGSATRGRFCLPEVGDTSADPFLEKGYVPLAHQTRQGNTMVSWYRGPFLPGTADAVAPVPVSTIISPDQLLRVHSEVGMFDVSRAAAWSLGRSLVLENKRVAQALFEWKRACVQAKKANVPAHLPCKKAAAPVLPPIVNDWFTKLCRLEQVPFNYLVPHQKLLPAESIHFFSVDPEWVQLLVRGAFAVGDIASSDESIEDALFEKIPVALACSGFLLRSPVVAGWPHLFVDGFDIEPPDGTNPPFESGATALVQHRYLLGKDTLLCLFEGAIRSVEVYLKPETIHYGINYENTPPPCYVKHLRDANGDPVVPSDAPCGADRDKDFLADQWVRIPFRASGSGVIDVATLAQRFGAALPGTSITPAQFAYQMVEGVPKRRFTMYVGDEIAYS